jgi:hypothetical protein
MAKLLTRHSQPHWYKMMAAIALLAAATVAGLAGADSRTGLGAWSAVDFAASERVTVIHKDPRGAWPQGNVWIGLANCDKGGSGVVETTRCSVVINPALGIDV